jgi:hypothetical protein
MAGALCVVRATAAVNELKDSVAMKFAMAGA